MQRLICILIVAITLLGAASCQTKPQLPAQWWATLQMVDNPSAELSNTDDTVWHVWVDNSNTNAPRVKTATFSSERALVENYFILGNIEYQLSVNSTGGVINCNSAIVHKEEMSLVQFIVNFMDGATFQGSTTFHGNACDLWAQTDTANRITVGGCFVRNTPIEFILTVATTSNYFSVLQYGDGFNSQAVFSLPPICLAN